MLCPNLLVYAFLLLSVVFEFSLQECVLPAHPTNGRLKAYELDCPTDKAASPACAGVVGTTVPEGWLIAVECRTGYVANATGTLEIPTACSDGSWYPPLPSCIVDLANDHDKCTLPSEPVNGKFKLLSVECGVDSSKEFVAGNSVPSGCVLVHSCDSGYQMSKPNEQTISVCLNSSWNPPTSQVQCERARGTAATISDSSSPTSGCTLPQDPQNRKYCPAFTCEKCNSSPECSYSPGIRLPNQTSVKIHCDYGYGLRHNKPFVYSFCKNNHWEPNLPECFKECPPLMSDSVIAECTYEGYSSNCLSSKLPNTTAKYSCRPGYSEFAEVAQAGWYNRELVCNNRGFWSSQLQECKPECGISDKDVTVQPTIVNGVDTKLGAFPWHAGLYKRQAQGDDLWNNICGGSLISNRVVLTAAHCVAGTDERDLQIGLGKYYRSWTQREEHAVQRRVARITVPREYNGPPTYPLDIALILLSEKVQFNSYVMPVCMDFGHDFDFTRENIGHAVGWGKTTPKGKESETLLSNDIPIPTLQTCLQKVSKTILQDKFCGLKGNVSVVEQGDSGGGLTVVSNRQHYIIGVVSVKYNEVSLFTKLSFHHHKSWVQAEMKNFERITFR